MERAGQLARPFSLYGWHGCFFNCAPALAYAPCRHRPGRLISPALNQKGRTSRSALFVCVRVIFYWRCRARGPLSISAAKSIQIRGIWLASFQSLSLTVRGARGNFLPMGSFLACHDYGQGGVWFYVEGDTVDQVSREFPALMFFPSDPPWWNEEFEQIARQNDPAEPPFSDILEKARCP
jgi:hypothetical protein